MLPGQRQPGLHRERFCLLIPARYGGTCLKSQHERGGWRQEDCCKFVAWLHGKRLSQTTKEEQNGNKQQQKSRTKDLAQW